MSEQSSHRATERPGRADVWHLDRVWPMDDYGLPLMPAYRGPLPEQLIEYRGRRPAGPGAAVHFFLEDYRFESVWFWPVRSWQHVSRYRVALSPDFSISESMPLVIQLAQLYRGRWCANFWRARGLDVIPSLTWLGPDSYEYCFSGIERGGVVAVGTVGVKDWSVFGAGLAAAIDALQPVSILIYGKLPPDLSATTANLIRRYPSRWESKADG